MKLSEVPWNIVKHYFRVLKGYLFTKPRPEPDTYVYATIDELRVAFGQRHFTNGWELSYTYRGEDLNMRRPDYVDDSFRWYQTHIRGWLNGEGVELSVHHELEPTEYPEGHLKGQNYSKKIAMDQITKILEYRGIDYEIVEKSDY